MIQKGTPHNTAQHNTIRLCLTCVNVVGLVGYHNGVADKADDLLVVLNLCVAKSDVCNRFNMD